MTSLSDLSQELETLVARAAPSVVAVTHRRGQGSGLVLTGDGYILTNRHVAGRARELVVGDAYGGEREAEVVGCDPQTDLAVLRVDGPPLPALPLADSRRVRMGQLVVAIGNPLRFERSVALGVVSALDRNLPTPGGHLLEGMIQTDAAINPGNSGGPLLDVTCTVVGINTAIVPYAQGIGFAVPAYTANWVAAVLIRQGEVRRPYLGIAAGGVDLPPALPGAPEQPRAVRVFRVEPGTPAEQAGLRGGDLLLSAQGTPLASIDDLQRVMVFSEARPLSLEVLRDAARLELGVTPRPAAG